jgi:mannose-6-phosphate isomerase-like protein (cupin superfamily)
LHNIEHKLAEIRSDWARRGYSFECWIDPPGQVWRDFEHDVEEIVALIEGEIEIEFAGKQVHPAVGDEVLIPPRIRHTVTNSGNVPNRWCFGYRIKIAR